jgi:alpha-L-fucosidase
MKNFYVILIVCALISAGCKGRPVPQTTEKAPREKNYLLETPAEKAARMAWWKEARFGMFIHFGLYAVPAGVYKGRKVPWLGEWIMNNAKIPVAEYETLAPMFNPVDFDADEWVRIAKEAGMKYIVITSKHHDGFALWDSKISDWDIVDRTPFKRDLLKELADACARANMPLGFYYSIMDWHHPKAQGGFYPKYNDRERHSPAFPEYAETYMKPQIKELLSGAYGDIAVLWFDGQWIADWDGDKGRELYSFVRGLKPDILVNNRVGRDRQEPETCQEEELIGDFGTPEQQIPETGLPGVDWESCLTMNDTWGYKSTDHNWKSPELLIRVLVDVASKGGNLLLNVGPTAQGRIPYPSIERLTEMAVNGEAIFGAAPSPFGAAQWGRYTKKGNKLFAHVFAWPDNGKLVTRIPIAPVKSVYLLCDKEKSPLAYEQRSNYLIIDVPTYPPDPAATVVVIETK